VLGCGVRSIEIVREELFENIEVSQALDLLRISANNGFCGFGQGDVAHLANTRSIHLEWH